MNFKPLAADFFLQPTLALAPALLGQLLVKETQQGLTAGWIVETEAYMGPLDKAAHSFSNRPTKRTEVMFGPPGYAYIYVMHTHTLLNVVSGEPGQPHAILIRAVEPHTGIELMYQRRGKEKKLTQLTSGPGKLTKALGIEKADYGRPFFEGPLYIAQGRAVGKIATGPRIGIENSGEAREYPWRFWEKDSQFVSR